MERSGYAFFRGTFEVNVFWVIFFIVLLFLEIYALGASFLFILRAQDKTNYELENRGFINALAKSFVIILLLHFVQMVVRVVHYEKTGTDINLLVKPGLLIYGLDGSPRNHFESFGVDLVILGICLVTSRLRYRTWSLKELFAARVAVLKESRQLKKK
ncbi:hypothetical protein JZO67_000447 [Enterococcus sp. 665A]|uniref:Integral membrane protein n=1 Tax=Candidatus Enterococcus ferrettii TaxID=2815324 RepID=A0ABV0EIX4_9ENTE